MKNVWYRTTEEHTNELLQPLEFQQYRDRAREELPSRHCRSKGPYDRARSIITPCILAGPTEPGHINQPALPERTADVVTILACKWGNFLVGNRNSTPVGAQTPIGQLTPSQLSWSSFLVSELWACSCEEGRGCATRRDRRGVSEGESSSREGWWY